MSTASSYVRSYAAAANLPRPSLVPEGAVVMVTRDPDATKNGLYKRQGGLWVLFSVAGASSGGGGISVAPGTTGNVLTSNGSAWTSAALPPTVIPDVALAQLLFVAKNGNDATGNGTASKPLASIGAALAKASATYGANDHVRIHVAPGVYTENLTISRQRTVIVGGGRGPEDLQTQVAGTVTVDCPTATARYNDTVIFDGMLIAASSTTAPALKVTGTGAFLVSLINSYVTTTAPAQPAVHCDATHASRPVLYFRDCVITKQTGSSVDAVKLERGDCRMDSVRLYASVTGSGAGISLANNATLTADRLQVDKSTSGAGIAVNNAYAGVACTLSNSSISCSYTGAATSPALDLNNSVGIAAYVWQCLLLVSDTSGNNAIDGSFNGNVATPPLIYGNLAFSPGTNTTIAAAVNAAKAAMTVIP